MAVVGNSQFEKRVEKVLLVGRSVVLCNHSFSGWGTGAWFVAFPFPFVSLVGDGCRVDVAPALLARVASPVFSHGGVVWFTQ